MAEIFLDFKKLKATGLDVDVFGEAGNLTAKSSLNQSCFFESGVGAVFVDGFNCLSRKGNGY